MNRNVVLLVMDIANILIATYFCLQCSITILVIIVASWSVFHDICSHGEGYQSFDLKSMMKLWTIAIWKMRSIYTSLIVHIFDFLTDLLVVSEWYHQANVNSSNNKEDINYLAMAHCSVGIIILYKIISSLAVLIDYEWKHALLQFIDVALFVEIYRKHKDLIAAIKPNNEVVGLVISKWYNMA